MKIMRTCKSKSSFYHSVLMIIWTVLFVTSCQNQEKQETNAEASNSEQSWLFVAAISDVSLTINADNKATMTQTIVGKMVAYTEAEVGKPGEWKTVDAAGTLTLLADHHKNAALVSTDSAGNEVTVVFTIDNASDNSLDITLIGIEGVDAPVGTELKFASGALLIDSFGGDACRIGVAAGVTAAVVAACIVSDGGCVIAPEAMEGLAEAVGLSEDILAPVVTAALKSGVSGVITAVLALICPE